MDSKAMEIRTKIRNWLISEGYETNKAYGIGGNLPHTVGIAGDMFVLVKPNHSGRKDVRVIAVYPTEVLDYENNTPLIDNRWKSVNSFKYESKEELRSILQGLVTMKYGCWIEG
jgi:hypothetical protein